MSLDDIALEGSAITPHPAIAISFRSFDTICGEPVRCTVEVADTVLQQGQGMHGSFSRADTWNFMAMHGPDFKSQFVDPAPASNADIGRTIAQLMHLDLNDKGKLTGRVLSEVLPGGTLPEVSSRVITSEPAANGLVIDKTAPDWPASIAATGLALAAYPVAVARGFMARAAAVDRTLATLRFFWNSPQGSEPDATGHQGLLLSFSRHADRPARLAMRTVDNR